MIEQPDDEKPRDPPPPPRPAPNIGDLTSEAKGTGARFNAGKPRYDLMAWLPMAHALDPRDSAQGMVRSALVALGEFQSGADDTQALYFVLKYTASAAGISMPELYSEIAKVLTYGERKYDSWNWAKGMPWSSVIACAARHLIGTDTTEGMWANPKGLDPESGCTHAGHVGCNVLFLLQYLRTYNEGDDRPKQLHELPF